MSQEKGFIEFKVKTADLDQTLALIRDKTGGHCIIGTRPEGSVVHVRVHGFSLTPGLRGELRRELEEKVQVHQLVEGVAAAELDF